MPQDISGAVTGVIVRYVRSLFGDVGVVHMLSLAGDERDPRQLADPANWSTHQQAIGLLEAATRVTGDPMTSRRIGEEILRQYEGTEVATALRNLGSPQDLLRTVVTAASQFSTVTTMEPVEVRDGYAEVTAVTRMGSIRHRDLCDLSAGLLSWVPVLFGMAPAVVTEPECAARGGRCCRYRLSWTPTEWAPAEAQRPEPAAGAELAPEEDERAVLLERQLARATVQLDAMLTLSRSLETARHADEVALALATAVPPVLGCAHSAVMVWDPIERCFIERASAWSPNATPDARQGEDADLCSGRGGRWSPTDSPVVDNLVRSKEVLVVDRLTADPFLRGTLERRGLATRVIAPFFADDELVGIVTADFETAPAVHPRSDPTLQERLRSLTGPAVKAIRSTWLLDQVGHLTWHDPMTGLPNRRMIEDRARQELNRSAQPRLTVFFIDLDRLKDVNDALGHAAGDELLRQAAQRLRESVRRQDTVARLGGDEFAILLPGMTAIPATRHLAHQILKRLHEPYRIGTNEVFASASIGIAAYPEHGESYDALLSHANEAMYRAKALGRNTFALFSEHEGATATDLRLEADLHHALERNELFLLYQPYVDLQSQRVRGVEALVRWRHPDMGILEPASFIPRAEECDVIVGIDAWVIDQAARQMRRWLDEGIEIPRMSVNVSGRDLGTPDFVDTTRTALEEHGVPPSAFELGVSERVAASDVFVRHVAHELRQLGVRFSIDDFGTGASSLSQMAALPVSTLKIDRSLAQTVGPHQELNVLASAIVAVAHSLGLACVAAGVETAQQREALLNQGVTTAQGYYFSPPLQASEVVRILRASTARVAYPIREAGAA